MAQTFKDGYAQANAMQPKIKLKSTISQQLPRITKRPLYENYLDTETADKLAQWEKANWMIDEPFDDYISKLQSQRDGMTPKQRYYDAYKYNELGKNIDFLQSNPNIKKFFDDRYRYIGQFKKDYDEYAPTAKKAIIQKLLGDGKLYHTDTTDDLYDSINKGFADKYGYEDRLFDIFYPGALNDDTKPYLYKQYEAYGPRPYKISENKFAYNKKDYLRKMINDGVLTPNELKELTGGK